MAIPVGTTSRQLETVGRWTLAGVIIVGMVTLWWPSYYSWGVCAAGLMSVFGIWLVWKTVLKDRKILGHPVHAVLLIPALILIYHLASTGLGLDKRQGLATAGAINMSMIFHIFLLALGIMLTQSLLPNAASHFGVLSACGLAMMGGAFAAIAMGEVQEPKTALALLGFVGIGVWLCPLWGFSENLNPELDPDPHPLRRRQLRIVCIAVAIIAAVLLTAIAPLEAAFCLGVVGSTLLLGGLMFQNRRRFLLIAGGIPLAIAILIGLIVRPELSILRKVPVGAFGLGEEVFGRISATDSGLVVLGATIGWAGLIAFVIGMFACIVWLLGNARQGHSGDQSRALVWTATTALVSCSMLSRGGFFIPTVTLSVAFVWGLFPRMLGRAKSEKSGSLLLVALLILMALLGVAKRDGLLIWIVLSFGYGEGFLHSMTGFFLAMLLVWLFGSQSVRKGLILIFIAALAGGAGEILQSFASARGESLAVWVKVIFGRAEISDIMKNQVYDWFAHSIGCVAAFFPYFLAMCCGLCESPDAKLRQDISSSAYSYRQY